MVLGKQTAYARTGIGDSAIFALQWVLAWVAARITWLSLIGFGLLVALFYGRALGFAFFFDDTFDLTRTEGRSYWSLLSSSAGYSYYRPLPFVIWKLLRQVQGQYDQTTLHLLPVLAHALAGWLLFLLVRRFGFGNWALVPAVLFLTFPFDYQSVAIAGTLFHPMAGAAILGALLLYLSAREALDRRRSIGLHCAALLCTCIALWTHESGIVVAPLIVGLEGLTLLRRGERRPNPWLFGHIAAALLFVVAWFSVEKTPFGEQTSIGEARPKGLFLLQGFTYPFSAQIHWLEDRFGWAPGVLQVGMLALVFGTSAYALAGWRSRDGRRGVLRALVVPAVALGIALVAFAPALVRLSYSYVEDSPRLLYLVGIGAAIFWGLLPALDFRERRVTVIWRVATCLLLLGVVVQSWRFIDVRMTMFARGTEVVDAVVRLGEQYRGQRIVVLNVPAWFALDRYEYPAGHYGVQVMPAYIGLDRVIYTSSSYSAFTEAASANWNPDVSGGVYPFGPHGATTTPEELDRLLREGREVIDVHPDGARFVVRDVGRLVEDGAEPSADFPGTIAERIAIAPARVALNGAEPVVLLQWHVLSPLASDANATVEVRDASGDVVAMYQGYPLAGFSAPRLWQAGDRIDDSVFLEPLPSGEYTVWAGLNTVEDDEALAAVEQSGEVAADGMLQIGAFRVP